VKITDEAWPELTDRLRAVFGDAAARRVLVPGRGAVADCVVEWASTAPPATTRQKARPLSRFLCRDGDPACDTDAVAGQCTIEVQACVAITDSRRPRCLPRVPTTIRVVAPSARKDPATRDAVAQSIATVEDAADAAAGSCGPAVAVTLPVNARSRVIRTVASGGDTRDRDAVRVSCKRGS
jgi:hypothetical protein